MAQTFVKNGQHPNPAIIKREIASRHPQIEWKSFSQFGRRLWGRMRDGENQGQVVLAETTVFPDQFAYCLIWEGSADMRYRRLDRHDCPLELVDGRAQDFDPEWAERVRLHHRRLAHARQLKPGDVVVLNENFGTSYGLVASNRPLMASFPAFGQPRPSKINWEMVAAPDEVEAMIQNGHRNLLTFMHQHSLDASLHV